MWEGWRGQSREAKTLHCGSQVGGPSWAGEGMESGLLRHLHPAAVPREVGELPNKDTHRGSFCPGAGL